MKPLERQPMITDTIPFNCSVMLRVVWHWAYFMMLVDGNGGAHHTGHRALSRLPITHDTGQQASHYVSTTGCTHTILTCQKRGERIRFLAVKNRVYASYSYVPTTGCTHPILTYKQQGVSILFFRANYGRMYMVRILSLCEYGGCLGYATCILWPGLLRE